MINGLIAPLFTKMEEKFNALCIRSVSYKDNDKMLTLFSLEKGIVDCILRGVKKPNAKLRFAGELFCFSEYVVAEKNGRRTVIEANEIDNFYEIRLDIDKYYAATAIIEYVRTFALKGESYYELFLNTLNGLKAIQNGAYLPQLVLVKYYMEGLKLAGYGISYSACEDCGVIIENRVFFDFNSCVFKCADCADYSCTEMRIGTYKLLSLLDKIELSNLKNMDKSTYSPTFDQLDTIKYALKFFDFFIKDKVEVQIKSNQALLV